MGITQPIQSLRSIQISNQNLLVGGPEEAIQLRWTNRGTYRTERRHLEDPLRPYLAPIRDVPSFHFPVEYSMDMELDGSVALSSVNTSPTQISNKDLKIPASQASQKQIQKKKNRKNSVRLRPPRNLQDTRLLLQASISRPQFGLLTETHMRTSNVPNAIKCGNGFSSREHGSFGLEANLASVPTQYFTDSAFVDDGERTKLTNVRIHQQDTFHTTLESISKQPKWDEEPIPDTKVGLQHEFCNVGSKGGGKNPLLRPLIVVVKQEIQDLGSPRFPST